MFDKCLCEIIDAIKAGGKSEREAIEMVSSLLGCLMSAEEIETRTTLRA